MSKLKHDQKKWTLAFLEIVRKQIDLERSQTIGSGL